MRPVPALPLLGQAALTADGERLAGGQRVDVLVPDEVEDGYIRGVIEWGEPRYSSALSGSRTVSAISTVFEPV